MRSTYAIVLLSLIVAGCSDTNYNPTVPADTVTDPEQTQEDTELSDGMVGPDIIEDWSAVVWCQPKPVAYDTIAIPKLAVGVALDGFCDATTPGGQPEGEPTMHHVLDQETRVLQSTGARFDLGSMISETTFTFDADGHVRNVFVEGMEGFYGSGMGRSWYDLDTKGEMTHKVAVNVPFVEAPEEMWDVLVKEQTWDGDRLLSRTEHQGQDGPLLRRWDWEWDGALLRKATLTDLSIPDVDRVHVSAWTYTAADAPASVERSINGVVVERETWSYNDDGSLASRTSWLRSVLDLVDEFGGNDYEWVLVRGLDSYQRSITNFFDNPWDHATPKRGDECIVLPNGPGHGYPDAEPEYQLGVPHKERPAGIGFDHGSDTYGWNYGDLAWYGHHGLGSGRLFDATNLSSEQIDAAVYYDGSGRMNREVITVVAGGLPVEIERTRTLDPTGAIEVDLLVAHQGDETHASELSFERDANGFLIGRTLSVGDRVERQNWIRDAKGRALEYTIEPQEAQERNAGWEVVFESLGGSPIVSASWFWRYENDRLVERGGGTNSPLLQTLDYNEDGKMISSEGRFLTVDSGGSHQWTWNSEGQMAEYCQAYGENAPNCTSTTYDSAGRVVWKTNSYEGAEPVLSELHEYTCR